MLIFLLLLLLLSLLVMSLSMFSRSNRYITSSLTRLYSGGKIRDGLGIAKGYANNQNRYVLEQHTLSGLPIAISKNDDDIISKSFIVLGIESSCDDTGVAIVRSDGTILSNIVLSQVILLLLLLLTINIIIIITYTTTYNSMRFMRNLVV